MLLPTASQHACTPCCLHYLTLNPKAGALAGPDERVLAREQGLVGLGAGVPVLDTSHYPFTAIGLIIANEAFNVTTGRVWNKILRMQVYVLMAFHPQMQLDQVALKSALKTTIAKLCEGFVGL